ncbi:hypothetical protein AXF42_Ash014952 [Apostasia shenzhenica]|uniref:Uncharacterized protein n=1 Tax=Apostasia shenzhenica TaxID=1088818 RepID=A0A2I0ALL7_9ASPA|nr:hypothetical protein AXF42_Ash014952 [Apostasia shenzhenica]
MLPPAPLPPVAAVPDFLQLVAAAPARLPLVAAVPARLPPVAAVPEPLPPAAAVPAPLPDGTLSAYRRLLGHSFSSSFHVNKYYILLYYLKNNNF